MSGQGQNQSENSQGPHKKPKWMGSCDTLPPDYLAKDKDGFVLNQLVVTGTREDIKKAISQLRDGRREQFLGQSQEINSGSLGALSTDGRGQRGAQTGQEPVARLRFRDDQLGSLASQVYRLPADVELGAVIADFYAAAIAARVQVYAEPNYMIGSTVAGFPGCIEGGPVGTAGHAPPGQFWNQWALDQKQGGITKRNLRTENEGVGIRVAVFDTSPFHRPGRWYVPWPKDGLGLCVSHPRPLVDIRPEREVEEDKEEADYADHGLFVAGMVYAVASLSDIHLIRVLNADNLGDLGTLIKALCDFVILDSPRRAGKLDRTVLNLSLGLVVDPSEQPSWLSEIKDKMHEMELALDPPVDLPPEDTLPVVYLETVLGAAWKAGATIVAATGNKSDSSVIRLSQIPAAYKFVIGVTGHNKGQARSSFANKGNIAAPGGDGPPHDFHLDADRKAKDFDNWLVGLSAHSGHPSGYMYWMGTSFAAPLVAGYAARLLGGLTPEETQRQITEDNIVSTGDGLGNGIFKF